MIKAFEDQILYKEKMEIYIGREGVCYMWFWGLSSTPLGHHTLRVLVYYRGLWRRSLHILVVFEIFITCVPENALQTI